MTFKEATDFINNIDTSKVNNIVKFENATLFNSRNLISSIRKTSNSNDTYKELEFDFLAVYNTSVEKQKVNNGFHCLYYWADDAQYIPTLHLEDFKYPNDFHPFIAIKPQYCGGKIERRYIKLDDYYSENFELKECWVPVLTEWLSINGYQ